MNGDEVRTEATKEGGRMGVREGGVIVCVRKKGARAISQ